MRITLYRILLVYFIGLTSYCITRTVSAYSPLLPDASTISSAPPKNNASRLDDATHIKCHSFTLPLFSALKPVNCGAEQSCTKRLVKHFCQANSEQKCNKARLWRPIHEWFDLPQHLDIVKLSRTPQEDTLAHSQMMCVHYKPSPDK